MGAFINYSFIKADPQYCLRLVEIDERNAFYILYERNYYRVLIARDVSRLFFSFPLNPQSKLEFT